MRPVLVDSNLLLLLIVGSANRTFITRHKRLQKYDEHDFEFLVELIGSFPDVVTVPHVLTEVSNLSRQTGQLGMQALPAISAALKGFAEGALELAIPSTTGLERPEATLLGLTDSILLHLSENEATLLTDDQKLAESAETIGCDILKFSDI